MTARGELFEHVMGLQASICGQVCVGCTCRESDAAETNKLIEEALEEHAHELAEKIREFGDGTPDTCRAADLVDPEVIE